MGDRQEYDSSDTDDEDEEENLVTRLLLRITCANLPRVGVLKSQPNTFAIVTSVKGRTSRSGAFYNDDTSIRSMGAMEWGQTEIIHKNSHPQFMKTFELDYEYGEECYFHVDMRRVKDSNSKDEPVPLGSATCEVGDILGSRNRTKAKRLPKGGVVFCRLEAVNTANKNHVARFKFHADISQHKKSVLSKLKLKGAPDTVFQISKRHPNAHRQAWITVYRSSPVKESLQPTWDNGCIDLETLCNGDVDRPLRLRVIVAKNSGPGVMLGECETNLRSILNTQRGNAGPWDSEFQLVKNMDKRKPAGMLKVEMAQLIDTAAEQDVMIDTFNLNNSEDDVSTLSDGAGAGGEGGEYTGEYNPYAIDIASIPAPVASPVTFQDYINDGLLLDFLVAIDFTSSNGDPRIPGTLHDQSSEGLNDYEESIVGIGDALQQYSDETTVWGFGAKFSGETRHLFQLGNEETMRGGVQGILQAYKSLFQSDLIMSGPTVFDQVIQAAAVRANKHKKAGSDPLRYCVLLILTDGIAQDIEETKRKLQVYGSVPLSVIFVGLGRSDFQSMHELTASESSRKNVTFVEFRQHQHDPKSLGLAALQDMPNQLVEYMSQQNILPSK